MTAFGIMAKARKPRKTLSAWESQYAQSVAGYRHDKKSPRHYANDMDRRVGGKTFKGQGIPNFAIVATHQLRMGREEMGGY
ncbi:MAG: hypothetical protein R2867_03170 [Caldilineaceae bacterium]